MDLDDKSRLRNVFWVDNRCRQAYKKFGNVVTFDATYLTNKTWLQCMYYHAPQGIITHQDRAMHAIQIIFPNTKNKWCLWHILKKFPEKFGYCVDKGSKFGAIYGLVYDSQFTKEFKDDWNTMIDMYDLHNNDWLSGFCVHSKTSLKQFVEQYERALRNKGILCRHAIIVLAWINITHIPEKYIWRRWRKDVRRAHMKVAINYDGLVLNQCTDLANSTSVSILDLMLTLRKGAPKKLRRKSPLEAASNKAKSGLKSATCKRLTMSNTSMLDGGFNV
ncbi:protein FAR-RED IMPAIRED RESPONSE 1-like [Olea europaea var. sylvestris]|uniref:protein FAR-RED IMPAIRED RESPONSE 1-like n=1 Tax=Olea europaea var. sylvestris TaxID=158386 RepID=UPI000C1D5C9A|nr:protein FAR-RED IMPAIRED RESPONSE 1-like [Olea europaea var. sylvestris]